MRKSAAIMILWLGLSAAGFADAITLNNKTSYPSKNGKAAVQWASTAKEVDEGNNAVAAGAQLNADSMQPLSSKGKVSLNVPKNAEYFRVLVWSKDQEGPDLLTNWVLVVPDKTYTLKSDQLIPAVLMSGVGC